MADTVSFFDRVKSLLFQGVRKGYGVGSERSFHTLTLDSFVDLMTPQKVLEIQALTAASFGPPLAMSKGGGKLG